MSKEESHVMSNNTYLAMLTLANHLPTSSCQTHSSWSAICSVHVWAAHPHGGGGDSETSGRLCFGCLKMFLISACQGHKHTHEESGFALIETQARHGPSGGTFRLSNIYLTLTNIPGNGEFCWFLDFCLCSLSFSLSLPSHLCPYTNVNFISKIVFINFFYSLHFLGIQMTLFSPRSSLNSSKKTTHHYCKLEHFKQ